MRLKTGVPSICFRLAKTGAHAARDSSTTASTSTSVVEPPRWRTVKGSAVSPHA
jgi:hypothetical protein